MTLLETHPGETDAEFRTATDAMLQSFSPDSPSWWHPYEVRGTYEYAGILFRQFYCIAGSVECWVWKIAREKTDRRVIVLPDESCWVARVEMVGRGSEVPVRPSEVTAVRPAG